MNVFRKAKQIVRALSGIPEIRLKRGTHIGALVNRLDEVDSLWVSEEWKEKPHGNAEDMKEELLAYLALGEAQREFTCPLEVWVAYKRAAAWGCLLFVPNGWTHDGGFVVSINDKTFREHLQSRNDVAADEI